MATNFDDLLPSADDARRKLDLIAAELIKRETVEGDEFEALMGGPKRHVVS